MARNINGTIQFEDANISTLLPHVQSKYQGVLDCHERYPDGLLRMVVTDDSNLTEADLAVVLADFDHSATEAQAAAAREPVIQQSARAALDDIPAWLRKKPAVVATYIDNNVTDLASAKVALKALAVAVIILARLVITDYIAEKETE